MNKFLKIDNIMYRVKDLAKAQDFYVNVLGMLKVWEDIPKEMVGLRFEESDSEIVLTSDNSLPKFDIVYLVQDVVDFCNVFKAQNLNVVFGPIDVRCGKYAVVEDISGNKLSIIDLTAFGGVPRYDNK